MKTPLGSSWFVAVGASAVVFIGAFAHFDPVATSNPAAIPPARTVADEKLASEPAAEAPLRPEASLGMAEVDRLAESHVDPGVILAFIQNSGQAYSPTADEILYLSHLGVPQYVIAALFPAQQAPAAPMPVATPVATPTEVAQTVPPQEAASNSFTEALAPYGNWVQVPDYGVAWQPAVEEANPDWKPYVDDGQWINSDSGWYWQSSYAWGRAPFHYGGWINTASSGWVWVPGKTWGPAWVAWRSTQSYVGWAPLPPGVSLNVLSQLTFNGHPVTPGFDFGLAPSAYAFVRVSRFLNADLPRHVVPAPRAATLVAASAPINNYSVVNNKIINGGASRNVIAAATKKPLAEVALQPVSSAPPPLPAPAPLLASARDSESAWSSMQLPPLHYAPPPSVSDKREFVRAFETGPAVRPAFRGFEAPPLSGRPRGIEERRSAPSEPARAVAASSTSATKSTR